MPEAQRGGQCGRVERVSAALGEGAGRIWSIQGLEGCGEDFGFDSEQDRSQGEGSEQRRGVI